MASAPPTKRLRGTSRSYPIIHGSVAFPIGKKGTEAATHKWHVYVRGHGGRDMAFLVKHVEFTLHDSFDPKIRVVASPPYEVVESGWGEFEVKIRIFFKDNVEKPVTLYHLLKLFPPGQVEITKKPVVSEFHDEIVFEDPTQGICDLLDRDPKKVARAPMPVSTHYLQFPESEEEDVARIQNARRRVVREIERKRVKYEALEAERAQLDQELREIENK